MKRKCLLLAIPVLMVLSGCNQLSSYAAAGTKANLFVEDTLAHEEIFEDAGLKGPAIRQLAPVDSRAPAIGIQTKVDNKGTDADESDDTISIRLVAAITVKEGGLSDTTATWTREMHYSRDWYQHEGAILRDEDSLECTTAYTSITDNGAPLAISTFNTANGTTHTHFVAYTMRNIPLQTYHDCYLLASLDVVNSSDSSYNAQSRIMAAKVDGGVKFSFETPTSDFFLAGTIGGAPKIVAKDNPTRGDGNAASFTTDLSANDSFVVVQKEGSTFKVWDGSCLDGDYSTYFAKDNNRVKAKSAGNFRFYLNTSNKIYASSPCSNNVGTTYYLRGDMSDWNNVESMVELKTNGDWNNIGVIKNITMSANQNFKIALSNSWDTQWNYWGYKIGGNESWRGSGISNVIGGAKDNFEGGSDNNIKCKTAGTYDIYLTDLNYISIEVHSDN